MVNLIEIFITFLRLGLTSFGGPTAHLSYFHNEFVLKKKWLDEPSYADLVGLCQFLPGPASSQVGIAIGLARGGIPGSIAAWLGFTLPSAILLILFGLGVSSLSGAISSPWLHGLKIAAVSVVAQAIWVMGQKLCPDKERIMIALLAFSAVYFIPTSLIQILTILFGAILGWIILKPEPIAHSSTSLTNTSRMTGGISLLIFASLLIALPLLSTLTHNHGVKLFDIFFRVGSLVFGGGHVVLPLLQAEVVPQGWVSKEVFMAGYGATQAVPGPLFAFSAYLGAVSKIAPTGWLGGTLCLIGAFLPSFFLVIGALPFWNQMRRFPKMKNAMQGINAAVVGILFGAFLNPVWSSAIFNLKDIALAIFGFILLFFWRVPTWAIVLISGAIGGILL